MKFRILLSTMLILITSTVFSQKLKSETSASGSYSDLKGDKTTTVGVNESANFKIDSTTFMVDAKYLYILDGGVNTFNEWKVALESRFQPKDEYFFAIADFEASRAKGINYKYVFGGGYAKYFRFDSLNYFSLSYAPIYDVAYIKSLGRVQRLRHSFRFKANFNLRGLQISTKVYYQPAFTEIRQFVFSSVTKVSYPISKHVNLQFLHEIDIENYKPLPILKFTNTAFGVGYIL